MPEPFKNFFNVAVIGNMADHLAASWTEFDREGFVAAASNGLDDLELKERSTQITTALTQSLPDDFGRAGEVMLASLAPEPSGGLSEAVIDDRGISGWAIMPMTHYVALNGQDHFELSMTLLKEMTKLFSSEFGIRFFLLEQPERTLATVDTWTQDPDRHVRRLASEGLRPRLPWAMQLPAFIEDPSPVLAILERLKDDESDYVRRSVANNLNDIAKDHPELVADIARRWLKDASPEREQLVRHACRTLIKQGHQPTLEALGYRQPEVSVASLEILTPTVQFGDALDFALDLTSDADTPQCLIIDYAVHHRKANGDLSRKVFKWKTITLPAGETHSAERQHKIRPITTRKYYPGAHRLELLINGISVATREFDLVI
ncbi:MAG: DNA alkylation repair protein [Pseudomonadota bacterium]